jgi:putative oxidoreductase
MAEANPSEAQRSGRTGRVLLLAGRLLLGAIFVYSAYAKLRNPWMLFAMSVDSYRMLPEWAVEAVARVQPWVELLVGLLLILGWGLRWVAAAATVLLIGFFSAMVRAQVYGLAIDCGCFGIGERLGPKTFVRDGLFVALAIAVTLGAFLSRRARRSPG